jgi:hypothetical protein
MPADLSRGVALLQVLPYELLQGALAIGTVRDLEDFIISDCFYTGEGCAQRVLCHIILYTTHIHTGGFIREEKLFTLQTHFRNQQSTHASSTAGP